MAKTNNLHDFLVDLANTIRTKKKYPDSQKINPQDFSDEIDGISGENRLAKFFSNTLEVFEEEDFGGITAVPDQSFYKKTSIREMHIPQQVSSFSGYAMTESKVERVYFPNLDKVHSLRYKSSGTPTYSRISSNLEAVSTEVYVAGEKLEELVVDRNVSYYQFAGFGIKKLILNYNVPTSWFSSDYRIFARLAELEEIELGPNASQYYEVKNGCLINKANKMLCLMTKNAVIPTDGSVTSVTTNSAFEGTKIKSVYLPDSFTSFGNYTFRYCSELESVRLPETTTTIYRDVFRYCSSLKEITIPASVKNMDYGYAFADCTSLKSVTFEGKPTSIASSTFSGDTALLDIYVPWAQGAVSGAPWGATNATIHYNWTPPVPGSDYTGTYTGGGSYSMRYFKIYDANDSLISSGDVDWEGTVTVPQGGHIVVSANETYGGIYVKVNNLVNCTASEVNSWAETVTITPTADNFSFYCEDDFD